MRTNLCERVSDELEPAPSGATIRLHRFLGVAESCINRLDKLISLLVVARCCSPLGSTPILVTHCGYSEGANGRS